MPLTRLRFTLRSMMLAVGIVAVVVVGEMELFKYAAYEVGDGWDHGYLIHEALEVWVFLNAGILLAPLCLYFVYRVFGLDSPEGK